MDGTNGIGSLQKMLGSLNVNEASTAATAKAKAGTTPGSTQALRGNQRDAATLSVAGGLAAQAAVSDVRVAKVSQLQRAIASGTYNVPARAVADKMIEGLLSGR